MYKYSCHSKASKPQTTNIKAQSDDKRSKSNPSLGCQTWKEPLNKSYTILV